MSAESSEKRSKRREVLPSFFVVILIGIAYQEMVTVVRDSVRSQGFTFGTTVLFLIFFLTAMRFFVGNELHLQSEEMQMIGGFVWFFDLMFIIFQTTIIIFLGGLASLESSAASPVGFFWLLIILYGVDVFWVVLQALFSRLSIYWRRKSVPWSWGFLNTALIVSMLATYWISGSFYGKPALAILGVLNALGFIIDMVMVDSYNLL